MEKYVPKAALLKVLSDYADLYSYVTKSQEAYAFICKKAKFSLLYIVRMLLYLFGAMYCWSKADDFKNSTFVFFFVVCLGLFICGFFTFESQEGGRRFIRVGILFHLENLLTMIIEFSRFKKLIGTKKSLIAMLLKHKPQQENRLIERYLYMYGKGKDLNEYIRKYNREYINCVDFINFDQHWAIARELYGYVESGRVGNGREALQYYDTQSHRRKVEYQIQRQNDINQEMVDQERERIDAILANTKAQKEKTKAATQYTDAVQNLATKVNENGGISGDDVTMLEDTLKETGKSLEG